MNKIITITALGDNYIYLFEYKQGHAVGIDPGDSGSVFSALKEHNLKLEAILITHHHFDHTAGAATLKKKTGCEVITPDKKRISSTDKEIRSGDILKFANEKIKVIATGGHTATSVCYYIEPSENHKDPILFTGDTLFTAGCGRIFECSAKTMLQSLSTLAALPGNTLVYPGHNYTIENYRFALTIEPDNEAVTDCLKNPPHPSTIANEKQTNIFLRAGSPEIKKALNMPTAPTEKVFAELRAKKDRFQ